MKYATKYTINFTENGDKTNTAISKHMKEFDNVYELLNGVRKLNAGESTPPGVESGDIWYDSKSGFLKRFENGAETNLLQTILNAVYPVGSCYSTIHSGNPNDIIGFYIGEWTKLNGGYFMVSSGTGYDVTATVDNQGKYQLNPKGLTETKTTSTTDIDHILANHTHDYKYPTLQITSIEAKVGNGSNDNENYIPATKVVTSAYESTRVSTAPTNGIDNPKSSHSHTVNVVPPYYAVNIWIRVK